tara:strand:- start:7196 stop:7675 length:480 start_codon:yes stop_codon:yes gene_type:complete
MKSNVVRIEVPRFITHIQTSKFKYSKISGQKIFVGMNHHLRGFIVRKMHKYLSDYIPDDLDISHMTPVKIKLQIHAPSNFENVRMVKGTVRWKPPKNGFNPRWDVDNMWIWGKCFNDTLVEKGVLPDDNIAYVQESGGVEWREVDHLDKRKLVFVISKY